MIRVITKLPNTEQSSKGKSDTHSRETAITKEQTKPYKEQ